MYKRQATEEDLVKYAFALFLNHDFNKSLEVANMGLQKNARHAAFNQMCIRDSCMNCVTFSF